MIKIYPTKLEAYDDESKSLVFTIHAVDAYCAEIVMKHPVTKANVGEIFKALRTSFDMLKLVEERKP